MSFVGMGGLSYSYASSRINVFVPVAQDSLSIFCLNMERAGLSCSPKKYIALKSPT
jgi:hypothetical protein